jgi:hypothetical protein
MRLNGIARPKVSRFKGRKLEQKVCHTKHDLHGRKERVFKAPKQENKITASSYKYLEHRNTQGLQVAPTSFGIKIHQKFINSFRTTDICLPD